MKKILGDSSFYFFGSFAGQLAGFCALYLIMITLSVEEFGRYSYAVAFVAIFLFLADGGLSQYLIKKIAQNEQDEISLYRTAQGAQLGISGFLVLLLVVVGSLANSAEDLKNILVLGSGGAAIGLFNPVFSYLIAKGKKKHIFYKEIWVGLARLFFAASGLLLEGGVLYFSFISYSAAAAMLMFVLTVRHFSRLPHFFTVDFDTRKIASMFRAGIPYTLLMGANILYNKIDVVMLKNMSSEAQVGFYAGASQFVYPFIFVSTALGTAVFPLLAKNYDDPAAFRKIFSVSLLLLTSVGLILSTVLFLGSEVIFDFLFSGKYNGSIGTFNILVWYLAIVFSYGVMNSSIMAKGRVLFLVYLNFSMLALNVLLNLTMIPEYGAEGAAISTIVCEIIVLLCVGFFYRLASLGGR